MRHFLSKISFCQRFAVRRQLMSWLNSATFQAETHSAASNIDVEKLFADSQVQNVLHKLTGVSFEKVFEHRPQEEPGVPFYRLMTEEELQDLYKEANEKASVRLQIPPFLNAKEEGGQVLSADPEISGLDTAKHVFTDITYGISDEERVVVVRERDGLLRTGTCEERERMLRLYFSKKHRQVHLPELFFGPNLTTVLDLKRHIHVLDLACLQLEPYDPEFIRISKAVFEHANKRDFFDIFWSTRHCGSLLFYLAINKDIDNYLLFLAKNRRLDELRDMVLLYQMCHKDSKSAQHTKATDTAINIAHQFIQHEGSTPKRAELELVLQKLEEEETVQNELANL